MTGSTGAPDPGAMRLAIVDDHELVREGLCALIEAHAPGVPASSGCPGLCCPRTHRVVHSPVPRKDRLAIHKAHQAR